MAKQLPKRDLENVGLGVTGACVALVTHAPRSEEHTSELQSQ